MRGELGLGQNRTQEAKLEAANLFDFWSPLTILNQIVHRLGKPVQLFFPQD